MFGKYNGFVSKARVSACMYFLVSFTKSNLWLKFQGEIQNLSLCLKHVIFDRILYILYIIDKVERNPDFTHVISK